MINLTTRRREIETLLTALMLMLLAVPAISFGQIDERSPAIPSGGFGGAVLDSGDGPALIPEDFGVSVLELSGPAWGDSVDQGHLPPDDPFLAMQQDLVTSNVTIESLPQEPQQPSVPLPADDLEMEAPEVLLRGPLHEAFADAHQADPRPNPIINTAPPEAIQELPPEFKPEGNNVEWIPGYWAWDDTQNDFIWISGVWRDVPPNQRWVPGYWEQAENGHRWIAGFWTSLERQELNYLPTPPANLDRGPSVAAPSDDYFYCPGNWEYQNDTYVWRSGHWQPRVANWIWIPARYIWTPRGCVFRPGYWDREFDVRGTLFAPVHFPQQQYFANDFRFQPNHCVNTGADFFVHLFVRPNCNHYFYGDWYGQSFVNTGFRPWVQPQSHLRRYDPLLAHYSCNRYRQGTQLLINWVNNQHRHYHLNRDHRPRNTFQSQINFTNINRDHRHRDFIERANLVNQFDAIVRGRGEGRNVQQHGNRNHRHDNPNVDRKYVRIDSDDRERQDLNERLQRAVKNARKSGEQRSRDSGRNGNRLAQDTSRPQRGNKIDLPTTPPARPATREDRGQANGLTRAQIEKAQREQEKANRKRELEQKIAAAKQQAEIKRQQRDAARELSERQREEKLAQTRQRLALEKQARQTKRDQDSQRRLEEQQRRQQQAQSSRTRSGQGVEQGASNAQPQTAKQKAELAKQQRDLARQQRTEQNRLTAERAKQATQQKIAAAREASRQRDLQREREKAVKAQADAQKRNELQTRLAREKSQRDAERQAAQQRAQQKVAAAREASRQRDLQREREKAAKAQADAQRRNELQARLAREKSQRDAERRASQQRAQQKAQADAQRRAMEKAQRDAERAAADRARRAADAARKRQREQEQAARRAKRKKK